MSVFSRIAARRPHPARPLPYAPDSPEGLAARWLQWAASAARSHNPVADTTGAAAAINQPSDVWFLAGCFGGEVTRRCRVPAGVPLFFPAFNMWQTNGTEPPHLPRAFGSVSVDGVPVEVDAIGTPVPFDVAGAPLNPVTLRNRPIPMTMWGLWRKLDPPTPGPHLLRISGGDGHGFSLIVTYHLTIG